MRLLENDAFLEALAELFQTHRKRGAVVLHMKRYDGRTKPVPKPKKGKEATPLPAPSEYMCLVRAQVNKNNKKKISTIIHQKDCIKFQLAYCSLLKTNIDGLKRSKKNKKTKA